MLVKGAIGDHSLLCQPRNLEELGRTNPPSVGTTKTKRITVVSIFRTIFQYTLLTKSPNNTRSCEYNQNQTIENRTTGAPSRLYTVLSTSYMCKDFIGMVACGLGSNPHVDTYDSN